MTEVHRRAPDPEWVELYRRGMSTSRLAKWAGVGANTVRYHLGLAAQQEPRLREQHKASAPTRTTRMTARGKANMADVVTLYAHEGRLPCASASDPRERSLAVWLLRRRQDRDAGTLAPEYRDGLRSVPGWEVRTRPARDEARWEDRLRRLIEYRNGGNDWPRHKNPAMKEERLIGLWLQYQRTKLAAGVLDDRTAERLDQAAPAGAKAGPEAGEGDRPETCHNLI